jgi:hypothetical protein
VGSAIGGAGCLRGAPQDHSVWVAETLQRMETVKPGMTREALLKVFTTEGGLSSPLHRTFVRRACPFFKVDVEFQAVGWPGRDRDRRVTAVEDGRDVILKISRPYMQFSIKD